jgi:uncharacterized membrane protein YqaE (UPF0057 family)
MRYLLAVLLPPVAVLSCGKPLQAILNLILTIALFWVGGIVHALFVVHNFHEENRAERIIDAMREGGLRPHAA